MTRFRVIQLARLGDFLQSLPLCRVLRGEGELEVVMAFDPGLRLRREADIIRVLEPWSLARATRHPSLFLHRLRDALGGESPREVDLQICLNDEPAAVALSRLLPATRKAGAGESGDPYSRWLRLAVEERRENQLRLCEAMLACLPGAVTPAPSVEAPGGGDVVIHAGSGSPARRLPLAFWVELAQDLLERIPERRLVLTGSLLEATDCAELEGAVGRPDRLLNVSGALDLDELQELLDSASLVVAQDTGVLHLAAHLRRPLIGLFHGSAWAGETAPWLDGAHVLQARAACAPCVEGRPTCTDHFCRSQLDPAAVVELATSLLEGRAWPDLTTALCEHLVCVADAGGVRLVPGHGEPLAEASVERGRQLTLTRQLGPSPLVADDERALALDWALESGLSRTTWRRRGWYDRPRELADRWHWQAASLLGGGLP